MLKNKKAAVELQFHWIYVMLIGGALLMFFGFAIYQQQKLSKEKNERELLNSLEYAIRNANSKQGFSEIMDLRVDMQRECSTNTLLIGTASKQAGTNPVFSPTIIKGTKLIIGTVEWDAPFRAADFLLMATDEEQFIIIYDDKKPESKELFGKIKGIWPDKIAYSENDLADKGAKRIRILVLNTQTPQISFTGKETVITEVTSDISKGHEFGNMKINGNNINYYGISSVIAALFSDSKTEYECSMGNAINRLKIVAEMHEKKADELAKNPDFGNCAIHYNNAKSSLSGIKAADNPAILYGLAQELSTANNELLKKSCPVIY